MRLKTVVFLIALLVLAVGYHTAYGGTTGKISGTITDVESQNPLAGANVVIQGSTLGAACDLSGNYVILNVPPGTYVLQISMLGYQKVQYENVRVSVDFTTRVDAALKPTALEGETVIVTAGKDLVTRDMTSSLATTSREQIESLPVQSVQEVLRLNAGIVESDGRLHIRGGRPGEVAYWIDGVSVTDVYDGRVGTTVENASIQELQVISGTFNAEYGQAMSGIVNIVTREGSSDYNGEIKVYGGDYVSTDDKYAVYKSLQTDRDPTTGTTRILSSDLKKPLNDFNPIYNAEFSLSGPVPLLGNKVTFFSTGRYFTDEGYYYGVNWYRPNGAPGDSSVVALNPFKRLSLQTKVSYQLSTALKFSYNLFWSKSDRDRNYFRAGAGGAGFQGFDTRLHKYVPNGLPQSHGESFTHIFTMTHVLTPLTFYELRVNKFSNQFEQYVYDDPTRSVNYLVSVTPNADLGITEDSEWAPLVFDASTPQGEDKLNAIIALGGIWQYIVDPNGPDGYIDPDNMSAPTSYSYFNKGMDVINVQRQTSYWVGKFDLTSQMHQNHQVKFGTEVRIHELEFHGFQIRAARDENGQELTPFQPTKPEVGNIFRNDYIREPREFSAYLQDKIEFNNIILNVGVRYDYFDANSFVPTDPEDTNIYAPFKNEHIYANWMDMPSSYNGTIAQYIDDQLTSGAIREYTPDERRAFMHTNIDAKMSLSPRLGLAFPITDEGVIHFSYGHFFQIPEFQFLYENPDYKITSSTGETIMGNPDLEPQKTVMYEVGLQQQITDNVGVDLTLFYRDVRDWVGTSPLIDTHRPGISYSRYENKDYSNVRGITLKIEKRFSNNYSFRADYSFQKAEGTYSNPQDAYNSARNNQAPVLALLPMNWDQTHTANAQLIYDLSDWTFSIIGRYWSGRPYTPSFTVAEFVGGAAVSGLTNNSARRPSQRNIDLTINRAFQLTSGLRMELFVNVYNVLDLRDETSVYGDTGSADYTTNTNPTKIPYNENRISTVEDFVLQPTWYTAPRQIHFGLIFGF